MFIHYFILLIAEKLGNCFLYFDLNLNNFLNYDFNYQNYCQAIFYQRDIIAKYYLTAILEM